MNVLHNHFYSMTEENNFSKFLQIVNKNLIHSSCKHLTLLFDLSIDFFMAIYGNYKFISSYKQVFNFIHFVFFM